MTTSKPGIETAPQRLRTAVVGLGRIGFGFHAPAIARHPGYELVGVADPLPERRAEAAAAWKVASYESLEDLLAVARPELVVVASPTNFHAAHALAAYACGTHVLCDKPVARSVAEFDRMLAAGQAAGRRFLAYQPARFVAEVRALKALLARGLLGPIHLIRRARCNYVRRRDWQALLAHGGGMLNNYGAHCLDELVYLTEAEPIRTVYCETRRVATAGDAEDVVKAVLVMERGCLVDLEISQASALPGPAWQICGAHGGAIWDEAARCWRVRYFRPEEAPPPPVEPGLAAAGRLYQSEELPWREETFSAAGLPEFDYYEAAWHYFVRGEAPPVTPAESRQVLALMERCRASADQGVVA
jgi:predicted dehydrogenase